MRDLRASGPGCNPRRARLQPKAGRIVPGDWMCAQALEACAQDYTDFHSEGMATCPWAANLQYLYCESVQ
jgi:hypothetical protein